MEIYETLEKRSESARRSAWLSVALIVITVFFMIAFFYSGLSRSLLSYEFEAVRAGAINENSPRVASSERFRTAEIETEKLKLESTKAELAKSSEDVRRITSIITEFVTKIGTVLISLYMVQILLGLTRYHFRLADHLAVSAVAIKHADSDIEKVGQFMAVVGTNHIDFGKAPATSIDKIVKTIKELPDKIATTKRGE